MVFSCSSEVIMTPSGIPDTGVHVDKINTEVLKRSREDVESQKLILQLGEGFGGLGPSVGYIWPKPLVVSFFSTSFFF